MTDDIELPSPVSEGKGTFPTSPSPKEENSEITNLAANYLKLYENAYKNYLLEANGTTPQEFLHLVESLDIAAFEKLPAETSPTRKILIQAKLALTHLTHPEVKLPIGYSERLTHIGLLGRIGRAGEEAAQRLRDRGISVFARLVRLAGSATGIATDQTENLTPAAGLAMTGSAPTAALGFLHFKLAMELKSQSKALEEELQKPLPADEALAEIHKAGLASKKAKLKQLKKEYEAARGVAGITGSTGLMRTATTTFAFCAKACLVMTAALGGLKLVLGGALINSGVSQVKRSYTTIKNANEESEKLLHENLPTESEETPIPVSNSLFLFRKLRADNLKKQSVRNGWLSAVLGGMRSLTGKFTLGVGFLTIAKIAGAAFAATALSVTPVGWILLGTVIAGSIAGLAILYLTPGKWNTLQKWSVERQLSNIEAKIDQVHLHYAQGKEVDEHLLLLLDSLRKQRDILEGRLSDLNGMLMQEKAGDLYPSVVRSLLTASQTSLEALKNAFKPYVGDTTDLDEASFREKVLQAAIAPV